MKRIFKKPKPKSNTNSILNTKPKLKQETTQETKDDLSSLNTLDIHMIGITPLTRLTKKFKHIIFAIIIANIKKALALKKYTNPTTKVPVYHYKNLKIFL